MSFHIPKGSSCAVVGSSGSGKSTILKLLFRFYDIKNGSIRIGGKDIKNLKLDNLRGLIGQVPQDMVLFNDTIYNNIKSN